MDIVPRQQKIRDRKMKSTELDVLKYIASWSPIIFHKIGKLVSRYPSSDRICSVIDGKKFNDDMQSGTQYGLEYDDALSFFENYSNLLKKVPLPNMRSFAGNENADYADTVGGSKNVYLSSMVTFGCENVIYSFSVKDNGKNIMSSMMVWDNSENVYMSKGIIKGYNIFYSRFVSDCSDIWFSTNMMNCHNCLLCSGLTNQSYCIRNQQFEKEEYANEKKKILQETDKYWEWFSKLDKKGENFGSKKCTGSFVVNSEDVENGHCVYSLHGGRNLFFVGSTFDNKNMLDGVNCSFFSDCAGNMSLTRSEHIYNSVHVGDSSSIYYSNFLLGCKFCLGCIGLKNKQYCILNKEYTKEDWHRKVEQIFASMEKEGCLGDFFPPIINPFNFNDTIAYFIGDFKKEEILNDGFLRRDGLIQVDMPTSASIISNNDLQPHDYAAGIVDKIIRDEEGHYYRITPLELQFFERNNLPLPNKHWFERLRLNFAFNSEK